MSKKNKELEKQLRVLRQSKSREPMPRPVIFEDKSKYQRGRNKANTRKIIDDIDR